MYCEHGTLNVGGGEEMSLPLFVVIIMIMIRAKSQKSKKPN